jgi:hypothetical protein
MLSNIILLHSYFNYAKQLQVIIPSSSKYQTKEWRKSRDWYKNGKSNECEKYQIKYVEEIINTKISKTDDRINIKTKEIIDYRTPLVNVDGFEWSEKFDGKVIDDGDIYYFNFKFICDTGGTQTRSLRETYQFINNQLEYLRKFNVYDTYFINILDGDASYNHMDKFRYLLNKDKYKYLSNYIFVGSLHDFYLNDK